MARLPRLLLSQSYYHIMTRGNNRMATFHESADYRYYLDLIGRFKTLLPFNLFHYCLMPNHVHLLIQTKSARDFSSFMQRLNLSYYHYFNKKYRWQGHFWQNRYKSQSVGKDAYFIQCGKYIELNPVRAKLVERAEDYRFSSFRHYVLGERNPLIDNDPFFAELAGGVAERQEHYREMVVSEVVLQNYTKETWGSSGQRYNEHRKSHRRYKLLTN